MIAWDGAKPKGSSAMRSAAGSGLYPLALPEDSGELKQAAKPACASSNASGARDGSAFDERGG